MENLTQLQWSKSIKSDENAVIIDVRTSQECCSGIIENAKTIDIMDTERFLSEIEKLDKNKNYYIYCHSGGRSYQACAIMEQHDFQNVANLMGGIMEWQDRTVLPD